MCIGLAGAPPVTVTGVAPWAMNTQASNSPPTGMMMPNTSATSTLGIHSIMPPRAHTLNKQATPSPPPTNAPQTVDGDDSDNELPNTSTNTTAGYDKLLAYMQELSPQTDATSAQSSSSSSANTQDWTLVQAASTPTLQPTLKFHDCVFGWELGSGAFSVVRYARYVHDKTLSRSAWPEYAVKVSECICVKMGCSTCCSTSDLFFCLSGACRLSVLRRLRS
jgi:hypothetical protein